MRKVTLREIRNCDWQLIFQDHILRLTEGIEVKMLWSTSHYDGPATGVCSYNGERCWFDRFASKDNPAKYNDLEISNDLYAIVRLSGDELSELDADHLLFQELVGRHCDYTYEELDSDPEDPKFRRVRGSALADTSRYKEYCDRREVPKSDRFYDRPVIAWWACG